MLVLGIAIVAAALIPLVTLGSYPRLIRTEIHWGRLLAAGLVLQLGLEYVTIPRQYWHSVGYGLLVASYVLILAFCARNLVLRGMGIVLVGIACNALVIVLNQGMPVKLPPEWRNRALAEATVKHHPQQHGDKLLILTDIIILKRPYNAVMSFGDLILMVGLCDTAYNVSRNPRRRRMKARRARRVRESQAAGSGTRQAAHARAYVASEPDPRVESALAAYEPAEREARAAVAQTNPRS